MVTFWCLLKNSSCLFSCEVSTSVWNVIFLSVDRTGRSNSVSSRPKRQRAHFTHSQLEVLEGAFSLFPYPDTQSKTALARGPGLSDKKILLWFQNRRAKARKNHEFNNSPNPMTNLPPYYRTLLYNFAITNQIGEYPWNHIRPAFMPYPYPYLMPGTGAVAVATTAHSPPLMFHYPFNPPASYVMPTSATPSESLVAGDFWQ